MTPRQRAATLDLCAAILRCACCPPDLAFRARNLRAAVPRDVARAEVRASVFGR